MKVKATITTQLDDEDLVHVDALAERRGVSRDEMLLVLVSSGLMECEREEAPLATPRRPKRGAS